jgi:transcriptional regulator with XRE-family HTH domain
LALQGERPPIPGYPTKMTTIGDCIRGKRMDLGLFQKDVAIQIGVSVCTITNWERGHTEPIARFLGPIRRFLDSEPESLCANS